MRCIKALLLFVTLSLLLTACQGTTPTPTPTPTRTPEPILDVLWYTRTNPVEQRWYQQVVIPNFERRNPKINIILIAASYEEYDEKLMALVAGGSPPDIWSHWGKQNFREYVERGLVADLTPFIEQDQYDLTDFEPASLEFYTINGRVHGLPMHITGSYLFYNKQLLRSAGVSFPPTNWNDTSWTWSAFLEKCRALTRVNDDPLTDVYGCNLDLWPADAYTWLWGRDLYPLTAYQTGFAEQAFLDDPLALDSLQARQDLVWKYNVMPNPMQLAEYDGQDLFRSQKVAMQLTGGYAWWEYTDITDFEWGVAALPYGAQDRRDVLFTDPWMLSSRSRNPEAAWTFLKFLTSEAVQQSWMELTGTPPARKSLEPAWFARFPNMLPEEVEDVHLGALKYGRESPHHLLVNYEPIHQVLRLSQEPVLLNRKQPAEVLPEADRQLEAVLEQIRKDHNR